MNYSSPQTAQRNKKRRKKKARRALAFLVLFVVIAGVVTGVLLGIRAIAQKNEKGGETTVNEGGQNDQTDADPTPAPTPAPTPEPTPEPTPTPPVPYEENGAHYIDIEGVKVLIVNKVYHLSSSFGGENAEANTALQKMFDAAEADGITLWVVSGYRSYETQDGLFSRYASENGEEQANTFSARPGQSEHQTGMAFDLNSLKSSFSETAEYDWLIKHCAEYGFILRFLDGKQEQTGYIYEPWHYRYIGDAALAGRIMDSGLCLEEYAGLV